MALTNVEAAERLRELAERVGRLNVSRRDPEAFFLQRWDIEHALKDVAFELAGGQARLKRAREAFRAGSIHLKGRLIRVSVRRARSSSKGAGP
jgi:hypothetical protein